ncbi:uncharacterized protein LOC135202283 isoform X2 [Macrobrachium nipponense]|uniref:uncharacterized protein LOC135202283 isoform X2 n=1 Tax=Macrobrachium nipponense TaxID=159736 RepID=UPI0030C7E1D9
MAGTEMDKEVEYEGLEVPHSEGKPLRKKKAYMIAVVVASTSIIILLIILIIFINKMSQNDINVNEGFQAVLPQKKICFDPADPSTYEEYVKVYNKTIELTGYGPSSSKRNLYFDGDEEKYEMWEIKFLAHLRLRKLILDESEDRTSAEFIDKNADIFAEIVQVLDDKSLQLIMRDAVNDGRKALAILRDHYQGTGKQRIISLYTELTSLKMRGEECVTDYFLRA